MTSPETIFHAIRDFLEGKDAFNHNINSTKLPKPVNCFQLSCLGSGELKIQHELYFYLRCRFQQHVLILPEYRGFKAAQARLEPDQSKNREIDLMVFDSKMKPIVAIELKAHCANQGGIEHLLGNADSPDRGMISDFLKRPVCSDGSRIPLIQIGLFPAIQGIVPMPENTDMIKLHFSLFALIKNYVNASSIKSAIERVNSAQTKFELWWLKESHLYAKEFHSFVHETSFEFTHAIQQYHIIGATHYCVFLAN
jgi:hypothetical protein